MKKWLCLALALLTLTVCVWAAAESTDWNYDLNYAILRGYNGAGGDVTVPAEIDGYTVDVIGVSVFSSEAITSLTLPETVLELRSNAVSGCENMTSVTLPQSLVVINRMNFFSCTSLEEVTIPAGVRYIGGGAGDPGNTFSTSAYTLVDAAISYDLAAASPALKGWKVQVNAQNLFDKEYISGCYGTTQCSFGLRRTVLATLSYRW